MDYRDELRPWAIFQRLPTGENSLVYRFRARTDADWGKDEDDPDYSEPASCPKCGHFLEESVDEMQVFLDCPICDYTA